MKKHIQTAMDLTKGPIARGSISSMVLQSAGFGFALVQAVLTARLLGADGYGTIAFALALVQIFGTVAALGLGRLAAREIPARLATNQPSVVRGLLSKAIVTIIAAAGLASLLLFVSVTETEMFPDEYRLAISISALLLPFFAIRMFLNGSLQGFGRVISAQLPGEVLRPIIMVLILGAVFVTGRTLDVEGFLWITLAALAGSVAITAALFGRALGSLSNDPAQPDDTTPWLRESLPYLGLASAALIQGQINTLLLGWLATPEQAGLFQPIARLIPVLGLPIQAAGMRFAPRVTEFWSAGEHDRLRKVTWTFTWTTTLLTAGVALAAIVIAPLFLGIFGEKFLEMQSALIVLGVAHVINAAFGPVGALLVAIGRPRTTFVCRMGALLTNVVLCVLMIPGMGAMGAVYAMCGSSVVGNLLLAAMVWKPLGMVTLVLRGPPRPTSPT